MTYSNTLVQYSEKQQCKLTVMLKIANISVEFSKDYKLCSVKSQKMKRSV